MSTDHRPGLPADRQRELEQWIAAAGSYVVPSDELRPRVIDAAREYDVHRAQLAKLRNLGLCVAALWLGALTLYYFVRGHRQHWTAPSSAEVQQYSIEYATQRGYSVDWGMVDVFSELRGGDRTGDSRQ